MKRLRANPMRMSDTERANYLAGLLDEAAIFIKDLMEEVSQYRTVDREEEFLDDLKAVIGRRVEE